MQFCCSFAWIQYSDSNALEIVPPLPSEHDTFGDWIQPTHQQQQKRESISEIYKYMNREKNKQIIELK